ncbi:hypothetical protein ACFOPN_01155 [Xanthomonas hyacinthi]|uniref:hypothetical protein n=1 Tax=Xanthomonas hyacinthi TaxID=56455 RepID=UPI00361DE3F5
MRHDDGTGVEKVKKGPEDEKGADEKGKKGPREKGASGKKGPEEIPTSTLRYPHVFLSKINRLTVIRQETSARMAQS